ncbi:uncharacterized protein Z518_03104 [Rhinocladiella mackenziei CBS 650.93]|uniref:Isochorismatase-like domain-containing protein n=1 Tax=Rhinocladiella mackenziei CBS 650.93 TaxID=1442369 RepID=A0A0D2HD92_9EURO|nr:uncharacterized protein Z518_03104 [Rhinocladiella mackenziei CBS 650.93]KIX08448.1 hypothetical protein Z518_03104 [Rhinocladiella mackenziei CBS 650.93]
MPHNTALLVVDMQMHFQSMTKTALPNIVTLCDYFIRTSSPIIFAQHGHSEAELTTNPSPNQLARKWGVSGSIAAGSGDWKIMDELQKFLPESAADQVIPVGESLPEASSKVFPKLLPKNTYDAFINTTLSAILESARINRVIVCGVMTDCCCDTTARSAFNRGYETWLVSDACGSADKKHHEAGIFVDLALHLEKY